MLVVCCVCGGGGMCVCVGSLHMCVCAMLDVCQCVCHICLKCDGGGGCICVCIYIDN